MGKATNAIIQIEQGRTLVDFAALTDSGDHQTFTSPDRVWSRAKGYEPEIRPNGIVSGVDLVSPAASGANDAVDVAAFTAYSGGTLYSVAAQTDVAVTRAATQTHIINSITMDSTGAIAVIAGAEGTSFSETRGAAGGPPEIPADSVEIAQVRLSSATSAPVAESEIYQVVGQHTERYDYPVWEVNTVGEGEAADSAAKKYAHVRFASALPTIHAGGTPKRVYARYYVPVFGDEQRTKDFTPAEKSYNVQSEQYYGGSVASSSETLGQAQFTAFLNDGVTDQLVKAKGDVLAVKFFPDRNQPKYLLTQGIIGLGREFPVDGQIQATVTITAEQPTAEFSG
ncbi:MAG TPA: hypothetical protein ENK62_01890 [Chromatiales bacterium]|nr:hypothetical protein [Chromatiales bacterium]